MQNAGSSCFTCLSKDRNTWPLEEYSHIYIKLFDKSKFIMLSQKRICWECRAVFRKIYQFIKKATYAQSILSQENPTSLSTLKSVKSFHEQTNLNNENSQSKYEEVSVKVDYDSVINTENGLGFDLPLQASTNCAVGNRNSNDNFILDESLIKIERNTHLTDELSPNNNTSDYFDERYSEVGNSRDNETNILDVKNETMTYNTQLNNVLYIGSQTTKFESDDFNPDNIYDSEDEMIMDKKPYKRTSLKQRRKVKDKLYKSEAKPRLFNKPYTCNKSPVKFENTYKIVPLTEQEEENWMKLERMDVTFIANEFKCETCVLYWTSKQKMKEHNSSHHKKITEYKCEFCDAYFQSKFTLGVHQDSRHCRLHVCILCNTEYHTRNSIYEHFDEKHNNTYQCKECSICFGKIHQVREHYKEMHTRFECDYCNKVLVNKQRLIKHIRGNHQILCNLCNLEFVRRSALDYHYATRHKVKEDETTFCVECNKQYTCVMKYRYHIKYSNIHRIQNGQPTLIPRSVCPICKKDYYSKTIMENHLDYVHLKNYKYTCDICNKHVLNNDKLTKHKKRYHLGQKPPKNKICHICGRGFEVNKILRNHIRTHTGERPFDCPHCPSKFSQTAARYLHIKNVHLKNSSVRINVSST